MKRIVFLLSACFILSAAIGQNTIIKDPNAVARTVADFHAIHVATGIHLFLTQGSTKGIAVSASAPEYRDRIQTEVKNGVLHIYYDTDKWKWFDMHGKELKVYVSCVTLDGLEASSGAKVEVDGTIKSDNFSMDFSSGAKFTGKVEASDLKVEQSSGAQSTISGKAGHLRATSSSGSHLHGYDLLAGVCDVSASSGGSVDISVEKEMQVSAHSGGRIRYQGAGVIKEVHTSSGGSVSRG